jgi:hypothetical protein
MNKAQITIVEASLGLFLIFSFVGLAIYHESNVNSLDYNLILNSVANSILYSNNFREQFILENLSTSSLTENWSVLQNDLNQMLPDYVLYISNGTITKKIFSCSYEALNYSKIDYVERIISIYNNSNYEFRIIKLGVCIK